MLCINLSCFAKILWKNLVVSVSAGSSKRSPVCDLSGCQMPSKTLSRCPNCTSSIVLLKHSSNAVPHAKPLPRTSGSSGRLFITQQMTELFPHMYAPGLRTECVILGYFCSSRTGPDMFLLGTNKQSESLFPPCCADLLLGFPGLWRVMCWPRRETLAAVFSVFTPIKLTLGVWRWLSGSVIVAVKKRPSGFPKVSLAWIQVLDW